MAGSSSTITYDETGPIKKILIDWVSDSVTGAVTATTKKIVGQLLKVITDPGSAAPSPNWDVAITDEEGVDVLSGLGGGGTDPSLANRHTTNTEVVHLVALNTGIPIPGTQPWVCDKLAVAVTNAGNSKTGQIIIYWRP